MKKKIAVDLDGVITQFVPEICIRHNLLTGDKLKPADITDWDLKKFDVADDTWIIPGFFRGLDPVFDGIEVLWRWYKKIDFCIATDTMGIDFVQQEKQDWINEHVPFIKKVYFGKDKTIVPADILIEDGPKHLQEWPFITIKVIHPYNLYIQADYEVENWQQIEELFKNGLLD